jgi:very-short-patch-repair endonuclease
MQELINLHRQGLAHPNEIARDLLKKMTPEEVKLWVHLRSWRSRDYHFRRQVPKGRAIVDFACLKHRVVVELEVGSITQMAMHDATARATHG